MTYYLIDRDDESIIGEFNSYEAAARSMRDMILEDDFDLIDEDDFIILDDDELEDYFG